MIAFPVLIPGQNFLFPGTGRENLKCRGKGRDGKFEACIPGNHGKREFPLTPARADLGKIPTFCYVFQIFAIFYEGLEILGIFWGQVLWYWCEPGGHGAVPSRGSNSHTSLTCAWKSSRLKSNPGEKNHLGRENCQGLGTRRPGGLLWLGVLFIDVVIVGNLTLWDQYFALRIRQKKWSKCNWRFYLWRVVWWAGAGWAGRSPTHRLRCPRKPWGILYLDFHIPRGLLLYFSLIFLYQHTNDASVFLL